MDGQELDTQATANNYRFTGLEYDSDAEVNHAMYRQDSPVSTRWLSADPYNGSMDANNPQTLNRYAYVGNNPLIYSDPSGLIPLGCGFSTASGDGGATSIVFAGGATSGLGLVIGGIEAASCLFSGIEDLLGLFKHATLTASKTPRPGAIWDEHGSYQAKPNGGIGDLLGLSGAGCEFGVCGSGFAPDHQTASGTNPFPDIISDAAWLWALHADRLGVHGLWTYGNWCGAGGSGNPTTRLDAGCLQHDFCYFQGGLHAGGNITGSSSALQGCNQALCNTATRVLRAENGQGANMDEAEAALDVASYFSGFGNIIRSGNRCTGGTWAQ